MLLYSHNKTWPGDASGLDNPQRPHNGWVTSGLFYCVILAQLYHGDNDTGQTINAVLIRAVVAGQTCLLRAAVQRKFLAWLEEIGIMPDDRAIGQADVVDFIDGVFETKAGIGDDLQRIARFNKIIPFWHRRVARWQDQDQPFW